MANTNLGCGPLTVKYLVFISNFVFFLTGLILIGVGGVAQGFFSSYLQFFSDRVETPAIGVIILGAIIVVISFFGCCGAKKENVFMLRIFSFLMVVLLLLEFAAAITVAVMRPQLKKLIETKMNSSMENYGTGPDDSLVTKSWDDMQKRYECCGTYNYTDWETTKYGLSVKGVPDSCCLKPSEGCGNNTFTIPNPAVHIKGCFEGLSNAARSNLGYIIGGIIVLGILQMLGIWMSCCLIRAVKERYEIL